MNKKYRKIKTPKKYQKNKYFWLLVFIVIINVSVISYFVFNFFSKQNQIESQLESKSKSTNGTIDVKALENIAELNNLDKQMAYLDSIKEGDVVKINDTTINFPTIAQKISNKHVLTRINFIPKLNLDDEVSTETYPYLLNNKIRNLEISEPIVNDKNISLKWSKNEKLNTNSEEFLQNYLKLNENELTLNISQDENSIWSSKIPSIYKVKFLSLVMQKYDIHNLKINFTKPSDLQSNKQLLDGLYLLQNYLSSKKIMVNFDFVLGNISTYQALSDDNRNLVSLILKHKLNVNTFVLDFDAGKKQFINNRLTFISNNITSLKTQLKNDFMKYKNIEFNDSTLNSFISTQINAQTDNISYSVNDLSEISKLFNTYKLQKLYLNNVNVDTGTSLYQKSQFARYIFFEKLLGIENTNTIDRFDIYKIFVKFTKTQVDYNNLVSLNKISFEDFNNTKVYSKSDKVKVDKNLYESLVDNNVGIIPNVVPNSNWKNLGEYDKVVNQLSKINIKFIKHNEKSY